jgi:exopolysaccharide production protein ExoY
MTAHFELPPDGKAAKPVVRTYLTSPQSTRADYSFARKPVFYRAFGKRVLDIVLVTVALPVVVPVMLILAVLASLDGHSPFFGQYRVGRDGRTYRMWKLRSMVKDAESRLETYLESNPSARAEWDEKQKLLKDPRITRIGRFIRKSSLDELPQLWNVLKGDMSLVGPRPMMLGQQALYPGEAYFRLRPGITGLWQVSERNESSFAERAGYDATYDRNLSFVTDVKVLFATVFVVLRCSGH